jgi:hypothetical protein
MANVKISELDAASVAAFQTKFKFDFDDIVSIGDVSNVEHTSIKYPIGIGKGARANENGSIAIGDGAESTLNTDYDAAASGGGNHLAIGHTSKACAQRATAVGAYAIAGSVSSTALGFGAIANSTHALAVGRGAYVKNGQGAITVIGSSGSNDLYIANGWGHTHDDILSVGLGDVVPSEVTKTVHGQDAYDSKETPDDFNVAGGHLALAAGRGTGSGDSGEVKIQTAPVASAGQNVKNTLVDAAKFDGVLAAAGDTRFLLLDLTDGTLKRVSFGADDSGGAGYKVLRVEN